MIKNKIYYMLLGLGLGIIISSSLNIVFNKTEIVEYTDEEIKEKAKDLGMISIKENIENNDKEKAEEKNKEKEQTEEDSETELEPEKEESEETYSEIPQEPKDIKTELKPESKTQSKQQTKPKVNPQPQQQKQLEPQPQNIQGEYKSIVINELDTANTIINLLVDNGIIENKSEFRNIVTQYKLQTKFILGTYNLKQNSSIEEVLKILIKEKELKKAGFLQ